MDEEIQFEDSDYQNILKVLYEATYFDDIAERLFGRMSEK